MIISGHNEHFSGRLKYRREEVGGDPMLLLDFKVMNHEKKNARSGVSIQFRMLYCVYKVLNTTYFNNKYLQVMRVKRFIIDVLLLFTKKSVCMIGEKNCIFKSLVLGSKLASKERRNFFEIPAT